MFGGNSDERFVSVASAQNLARTMNEKSSTPFAELWFVSPEGTVALSTIEELGAHQDPFKKAFTTKAAAFAENIEEAVPKLRGAVVFLGFHGTFGEDGKIQALLERNRIPFTGSGSEASHLCFEKTLAKQIVAKKDLKIAPELVLLAGSEDFEPQLKAFFKKHGKIVSKPVANGSSIGLHIIKDEDALQHAIKDIRHAKYGQFMSEKFIEGRELTIGIIEQDGKLTALPPSEVLLNAGASFDYDGKYLGRGTTEITPAKISTAECEAAQKLALEAHRALGCYGYSRTDAILTGDGMVFIETNTLPGLTKASFIPQQLEAAGITVVQFVEQQLKNAGRRFAT